MTVVLLRNVLKDTRIGAVPTSGRIPSESPFRDAIARTASIRRNATQKSNIKSCTAVIIFSFGALAHTEEAIRRKDDETMKMVGRIRRGVETVLSVLRRKCHVDTMPVRGRLKTKVFFDLKMFPLNFSKL